MSIKHLAIVGIAAAALTACGGKGGEAQAAGRHEEHDEASKGI